MRWGAGAGRKPLSGSSGIVPAPPQAPPHSSAGRVPKGRIFSGSITEWSLACRLGRFAACLPLADAHPPAAKFIFDELAGLWVSPTGSVGDGRIALLGFGRPLRTLQPLKRALIASGDCPAPTETAVENDETFTVALRELSPYKTRAWTHGRNFLAKRLRECYNVRKLYIASCK